MTQGLVLLTYNEAEALPRIFDRIPRGGLDEFFAVDGGSSDGTVAFLESRGVRVVGQPRRGRGVAFRVAAESSSADILCFFSPDGNEDPEDIPRLFAKVAEGYDMAVASRMMPGAWNEEDGHWCRPRKWVNRCFTLVANLLWNRRGPYLTDTINGFRALRREAFQSLGCDADGFVIEFQTSIRAMKRGLKVAEIPTREGPRLGGRSTAASLPTGLVFLRFLGRELWIP